MRLSSFILSVCIIYLSAFGQMIKFEPTKTMDCCKKMIAQDVFHHKPAEDQSSACEKEGCAMMFSCSICGFIPVGSLVLPSNFSILIEKPVILYNHSDLTDYHKVDWKPPKNEKYSLKA